jgi:hypothetical protein
MKNGKNRAAEIGLVLGVVYVIMGFAYGNSGVWILGLIFLSIGFLAKNKR